jgi:putative membrane protein
MENFSINYYIAILSRIADKSFVSLKISEGGRKMRSIYLLIITFLLSLLNLTGCLGGYYGPRGMGGWGHMMNYGCGFGGIFSWLLFPVVLFAAIYFIIQHAKSRRGNDAAHETPLDILKKRYARGEISKEEFDRMKGDLQ